MLLGNVICIQPLKLWYVIQHVDGIVRKKANRVGSIQGIIEGQIF